MSQMPGNIFHNTFMNLFYHSSEGKYMKSDCALAVNAHKGITSTLYSKFFALKKLCHPYQFSIVIHFYNRLYE